MCAGFTGVPNRLHTASDLLLGAGMPNTCGRTIEPMERDG